MYTALVLTEKSRTKLLQKVDSLVPADWDIIAHHMTINMGDILNGPLKTNPKLLGETWLCIVSSFSLDERVFAVGVDCVLPSSNEVKHITIAVNREGGGKPFHSNKLTDWTKFEEPFVLRGIIQVVRG
jgi:hypothetical protein